MVDYTEIRDDRIRGVICKLMSEMLDNPDENGIYPTSEFMWKIETFILAENEQLKGFVRMALDELGVPSKDYPAPVANAVAFLKEALKGNQCPHLPNKVLEQALRQEDRP